MSTGPVSSNKPVNAPALAQRLVEIKNPEELQTELTALLTRIKQNPRVVAIDSNDLQLASPAQGLKPISIKDNYSEKLKRDIKALNASISTIQTSSEEICRMFNRCLPQAIRDRNNVTPQVFPQGNSLGSRNNPYTPAKEDYITSGGKNDPWTNHLRNDGRVFPLTILRGGEINRSGMPETLFLQDGMTLVNGQDGKPAFRKVFYKDPEKPNDPPVEGIYFEVREPAGPRGQGGINGILAPASLFPVSVIQVSQLPQNQRAPFDRFFQTDDRSEVAVNRRATENRSGYFCTSWDGDRDYQYFRPTQAWLLGVEESNQRLPFLPQK